MSLLKDFYTVKSCTGNGLYTAEITLNPEHEIFRGHFPGNPVAPGVCMIQMIKELTENILKRPLFLSSASNVKFMAIINPEETPDLSLELDLKEEEDGVRVKNVTRFGETIALKMSVQFKNN
ncbi:3-hydroxyacyl-ACP dehydratase [Chryseobacterium sp. MFBS3-17]|uniref:3-hydroxyacyl-ACP dehydratase n=1 Tax=Chryseobacterium sp. MFBS3-17 TaxID=2886689 RepID=UPI001D0EFC8B|nr:3-hydroxyacyl-ACP dehydratase [Chryseobacterium sp. MFBS3-17]MCC2591311.1 3-hydroxyacyl-ACP dehydratase [Chryseobacterium sp. MFBS3-17]